MRITLWEQLDSGFNIWRWVQIIMTDNISQEQAIQQHGTHASTPSRPPSLPEWGWWKEVLQCHGSHTADNTSWWCHWQFRSQSCHNAQCTTTRRWANSSITCVHHNMTGLSSQKRCPRVRVNLRGIVMSSQVSLKRWGKVHLHGYVMSSQRSLKRWGKVHLYRNFMSSQRSLQRWVAVHLYENVLSSQKCDRNWGVRVHLYGNAKVHKKSCLKRWAGVRLYGNAMSTPKKVVLKDGQGFVYMEMLWVHPKSCLKRWAGVCLYRNILP